MFYSYSQLRFAIPKQVALYQSLFTNALVDHAYTNIHEQKKTNE